MHFLCSRLKFWSFIQYVLIVTATTTIVAREIPPPTHSLQDLAVAPQIPTLPPAGNLSISSTVGVPSWPPEATWPFSLNVLATRWHRGYRFTFSNPGPLPVEDLSRLGHEAVHRIGNLQRRRRCRKTQLHLNFPPPPFIRLEDGPFVSLLFAPHKVEDLDVCTINGEVLPLFEQAMLGRPTRAMRIMASIYTGQPHPAWLNVGELDIEFLLPPPKPFVELPTLPFEKSFPTPGGSHEQRDTLRFLPYHESTPQGSGSPYSRADLLRILRVTLHQIRESPARQKLGFGHDMFHECGVLWCFDFRSIWSGYDYGLLMTVIQDLFTAVELYGAFNTIMQHRHTGNEVIAQIRTFR